MLLALGTLEAPLSQRIAATFGPAIGTLPGPSDPRPRPSVLLAHSHNDFEQPRPLEDALAQGFHSVEADVWLHEGQVRVSHLGVRWYGSLEELYLAPLEARVRTHAGSVYGDGLPFHLWIDLKTAEPALRVALHLLLLRHSALLSPASGAAPTFVILTGDDSAKRAYVSEWRDLAICRDTEVFTPSSEPTDPHLCWHSLPWGDHFAWNGFGQMKAAERRHLHLIVNEIHRRGRRIRFWATPESEQLWRELVDAGVDQIGTDEVARLHRFLDRAAGQTVASQPVAAALDSRQ